MDKVGDDDEFQSMPLKLADQNEVSHEKFWLEISPRAPRIGSQMVGFLGLKLSTSYVANLM